MQWRNTRTPIQNLSLVATALCLAFAACGSSTHTHSASTLSIHCPYEGNGGFKVWHCQNPADRKNYVDVHTTSAATHNALRRIGDATVVVTKSGEKGVIDFTDATPITLNGTSGIFLIPIHLESGKWVASIWAISGEFETYAGLRDLWSPR